MAKVVLIAPPTKRAGNSLNDVVDTHDDNVELGPAYASFTIAEITTLTKSEVDSLLKPNIKGAFKPTTPADEWTLTPPETKNVWNDKGVWRDLVNQPKYLTNLNLTSDDLTQLKDTGVTETAKQTILQKALINNIALDPANMVDAGL